MKTIDYLKQVKRRRGIESDYALAKELGITRSTISLLMNGKTTMSDETALKVAAILELPAAVVVADAHGEREKNPEMLAIWRLMAEKFSMGFDYLIHCANPHGCLISM